ncbi:MAG: cystathionine beta-synthase [Candidatus Marinimicrobia bacterium]|nr:cystathionine beta-synthase [Candidatus Neomarinimicrobiota bacterium]
MPQADNILETVGRAPLVRLHRLGAGLASPLYAKVEMLNPGGSIKDRVAVAMVAAAERDGRLKPGGTIIEATAGNTGVGLALAAAVKGYRLIVVMPDKMSADKITLLRAYGAEVVITATNVPPDSPESYNGVADRLATEIPNAWRPNQFGNPANPEAHYLTTGPEIWEDTGGEVGVFVAGMGTGGTISGVGRYLKERNPEITIVGADPEGSILSGDTPRSYLVEGIGEDFVPSTFNRQVVDEMVRVSDRESFHTARRLAREEGILAGGSCGTALAAALRYAQRLSEPRMIVVLLPDTGRNYLSKFYNDEWLREKGLWDAPADRTQTIGSVLDAKKSLPGLIAVGPREKIRRAIWLMQNYNISQLPVLDRRQCVGSLNEATVMKLMHDGLDCENQEIGPVMGRPLPMVPRPTPVSEAYRILLGGGSGILVTRAGEPVGLVTRADLIAAWLKREPTPDSGPWGHDYAI